MAFKDPRKAKAYYAKWREENRERRREINKLWAKANPEKRRATEKKWKAANPEKVKKYKETGYARNRDKARRRMRKYHLGKTYGLTIEQYEAMLASQGGRCGICGADSPRGKHKSWSVDHCHKTEAIRGLLCHPCNVALGCMQDDPARLVAAANYVLRGGVT